MEGECERGGKGERWTKRHRVGEGIGSMLKLEQEHSTERWDQKEGE